MQVKLTPKTSYEVEIDGVKIPGTFTNDGEWNGMQCVKSGDAKVIVILDGVNIVDTLLSGNNTRTGAPVSASPSILAMATSKH